jgi:hypothetical protein
MTLISSFYTGMDADVPAIAVRAYNSFQAHRGQVSISHTPILPPMRSLHAVLWCYRCDTMTNLNRSLERRALREFAMRVAFQMSAEDSANLLDSPLASKLGPYRALFYDEEEGRLEKFRPYGLPSAAWLEWVKGRLSSRC